MTEEFDRMKAYENKAVMSDGKFGMALCAALGLQGQHVRSITIRCVTGNLVEIDVLMVLSTDPDQLTQLLSQYVLKPKEEEQQPKPDM